MGMPEVGLITTIILWVKEYGLLPFHGNPAGDKLPLPTQ